MILVVSQGRYLYTETSFPRQENETAALMSGMFQSPVRDQQCRLHFYYHMQGATIGTLNVWYVPNRGAVSLLFTRSGAQPSGWLRGESDYIPTGSSFQVRRFHGTRCRRIYIAFRLNLKALLALVSLATSLSTTSRFRKDVLSSTSINQLPKVKFREIF